MPVFRTRAFTTRVTTLQVDLDLVGVTIFNVPTKIATVFENITDCVFPCPLHTATWTKRLVLHGSGRVPKEDRGFIESGGRMSSLRPSTAYLMLQLAAPTAGDVVVDW